MKEKLLKECEKITFGTILCEPLVIKMTNVIVKDIGKGANADIRRICSFIRVCSISNENFVLEKSQFDHVDEANSKPIQSAANMNNSFVCFNLTFCLLFILYFTYFLN